ncbi:MAG: hypothetical protein EXR98_01665 [Gemmataceae bacterium]|nr:hypothetical protein [Gemmataceae bacterium]
MFRFWFRELMGWVLVLLGLGIFYVCLAFLLVEGRILEAPVIAAIGVFVFRGGIHLLKVAVAARIAMQVAKGAAPPARKQASVPLDW